MRSGSLSPTARQTALEAMAAAPELDVVVIGGGVVGAGAALDAVTRGLSTGLLEMRDWASGTSSRSSKLIHGGLRYLEMLDFALVREALRERGLLIQRIAPHLVRPVKFLYPLQHRYWERFYAGAGVALDTLKVDGGITANNLCMQMQADIVGVPVSRPVVAETTALGAAYAAGLAVGFWKSTDELRENWNESQRWQPAWSDEQRQEGYGRWKKAVERTLDWVDVG